MHSGDCVLHASLALQCSADPEGLGVGHLLLTGSHSSLARERRRRSNKPALFLAAACFSPFMVSLQASGSPTVNRQLVFGTGPK